MNYSASPKYIDEYNKFYKGQTAGGVEDSLGQASLEIASMNSNEALIRIGHFSHVECITFDKVRDPRTPKGKPYGTTRTLANGLIPFGWCKLEFVSLPSGKLPERQWPFDVDAIKNRIYKLQQVKIEEVTKRKQKQAAEKLKARQEKERQKALEAMSPEDRELVEIFDSATVVENRVVELYDRLDEMDEAFKKKSAERIKQYYVEAGKWNVKKKKKKQFKKVLKLKVSFR